jgi:hypothetical protein
MSGEEVREAESAAAVDLQVPSYRLEAAYRNLEQVIGFVANADNKAILALAFQGVILAALAETSDSIASLFRQETTLTSLRIMTYMTWAMFVICFSISVLIIFLAVYPRFSGGSSGPILFIKDAEDELTSYNVFFYRHIAMMSVEEFHGRMSQLSTSTIEEDLNQQAHANARIVLNKFKWLRWSLRVLIIELIFLLVAILFSVAASSIAPSAAS